MPCTVSVVGMQLLLPEFDPPLCMPLDLAFDRDGDIIDGTIDVNARWRSLKALAGLGLLTLKAASRRYHFKLQSIQMHCVMAC